ncbi:MAG: PIN domain-containing protein [Lachnospiraceae bacterium]|nr:PIN domain-containing protein [Lachnospiraceae bacterium]MBR6474379.1 PIN domain-containing protein [Lachnospiraceae bacterium]
MRVLIDTNVIIDVLQNREPWCAAGKKIFLAVANKEISGCLTAKEVTDIHYISRKQFKGNYNIDTTCREILSRLLNLFEVLDTTSSDCKNAFAIENNDYEDAVMLSTAIRSGVDCMITRDAEHYKTPPIPVYTSEEFVSKYCP